MSPNVYKKLLTVYKKFAKCLQKSRPKIDNAISTRKNERFWLLFKKFQSDGKKLWPQALKRCQNYKIIAQSGHTAYVFSPFSCPLEAEEKTEEQNFIIFHDRDQMAV